MNALDISIKSNLIMSFHFSINALDIGTMSSLMMSFALLFVDFETYTITIVSSLATHVIGTPVNSSVG